MFLSSLVSLVFVSRALFTSRDEGFPVDEGEEEEGWGVFGGWGQAVVKFAWPTALATLMEAFTSQVGARGSAAW